MDLSLNITKNLLIDNQLLINYFSTMYYKVLIFIHIFVMSNTKKHIIWKQIAHKPAPTIRLDKRK